ncbi:hypothetical protein [Streptomyces sp. AC1-42W]|uniref:hypothetical protein n=2 Tax=unclassified Streptomyces TaxID=2593676 RepID=UPI000DAB9E7B|nr:hypothetical protein [Streptomyces sp. AC1-42W]PZT81823.1 hypothetical protein DNK56_06810 [Streptomyces sp. AC1-42W]
MSENEAVIPSGIPVFTGNLALLDTSVTTLTKSAASTATAAGDVHSSFGGLQAFYKAPEADQLFATTQPVADRGTSLKSELETITAALSAYGTDAAPLVEKLRELKREAESFVVRIKDDDKWREDGDLVEENNRRHDEIAETWAAFQAVERACHDKIVALVGGPALKTDDGSGKKGTYGYDAETLKHAEGLPWGDPVEESKPWWQLHEHAWDFAKGFFVDGVWGTIKGLGTLVGTEGWDSAKQAWSGLGKLATGVVISTTPLAGLYWGLPDDRLPAYLRDSRKAMKETGKALLAWDQWSENPSRALGAVAFNVVTTVFTGGTGGAASGAGKAAVAAKALSTAGKVGRVVDPMTYVFKGAGMGLTKIGDGLAALKGLGQFEIPAFPEGTVTLPEGAFKLPDGTLHLPEGAAVPEAAFEVPANSFKLPDGAEVPPGAMDLGDGVVRLPEGVHPPEGALRVPEGALKLPDGTTALPENVLRGTDEAGNTVYLDGHGNLLREDGTLLQHNSAARQEGAGVGATRPDTPSRVSEMAGVGAHSAQNSVSHQSPGSGATDSTPTGGHGDGTPTAAGHGGGTGRAVPHQSAGHGGGDGGGPGHRPAAGHGLPDPRDPRTYTPAERQAIMEHQVERANSDPAYRKEYYRKNGYRLSETRTDWTNTVPPQLVELPDGTWVAKSDLAPPLPPAYLDDMPVERGRTAATPEARAELDELAKARHDAIAADHPFHVEHGNARREYKLHRTDELRAALDEAAERHRGPHNASTKASEIYGEGVARLHAIPELYPNAKPETLHGPKNGNAQFDQVYKDGDRFIVVEAKSHVDTPLGERLINGARYSQGSRTYFLDILDQMEKRRRNFPSDGRLSADLRSALRDGRVDYIVVRGQDNAGTYTGYSTQKFDIREPS